MALKEHEDFSPYVNELIDMGFEVEVSKEDGVLTFEVEKDDFEVTVMEPEEGLYLIDGNSEEFSSLVDAVMFAMGDEENYEEELEEAANKETVLGTFKGSKKLSIVHDIKNERVIIKSEYGDKPVVLMRGVSKNADLNKVVNRLKETNADKFKKAGGVEWAMKESSTFVAKAAYAAKEGKKSFKLGDKEFPVTVKKDVVSKITEAVSFAFVNTIENLINEGVELEEQLNSDEVIRALKSFKETDVDPKSREEKAVDDMIAKIKQKYPDGVEKSVVMQMITSISRVDNEFKKYLKDYIVDMVNEEVEDLEEVSKKTLGSYIKKATDDVGDLQRDISVGGTKSPEYAGLSKKRKQRKTGISRAVDRLTEEDLEESAELSMTQKEVLDLGRKMQQLAAKEKDDMIANAMANLGDHLEDFGAAFGPKSINDLAKKTGMSKEIIAMLIRRTQKQ